MEPMSALRLLKVRKIISILRLLRVNKIRYMIYIHICIIQIIGFSIYNSTFILYKRILTIHEANINPKNNYG